MKKSISFWQFLGFAVTVLGGTALHFLYKWLDKAIWIAPFSSVNESTWEHMKLLFWPIFIYAIIESFLFRKERYFWCIKLRGIILGLILIPVIFYTYNGVIGKSPDFINIVIFLISAEISFFYETRLFKSYNIRCISNKLAIALLLVTALLFIVFTFATPQIEIFKDPLTKTYGV